jgi:hypothetical protein
LWEERGRPIFGVVVRLTCLAVLLVGVAAAPTWRAHSEVPKPRRCSATDTRRHVVLMTGHFSTGGPGYERFCGRASVTIRVDGTSYALRGGRCFEAKNNRWVYFGLIANGSVAGPGNTARGVSFVLTPGNRPGAVRILDSIVQVGGLDIVPRGTAIVSADLGSAIFDTHVSSGRHRYHVTGAWRCG